MIDFFVYRKKADMIRYKETIFKAPVLRFISQFKATHW